MKALHIAVAVLVGAGTLVGVATPVAAAPPSNDTIAGATVISALPFTDTVDTTEASTDDEELAAAQPCVDMGAPAIEKAVWYTGTVSESATIAVDVTASSYSAGIAVFAGAPSADSFVTCGPGVVSGAVSEGQTFYVMVFDFVSGSPGGTLEISVFEAITADLSLSVDPIGRFDGRTGVATISGTATCTGGTQPAGIFGTLRQSVGRFSVVGFFDISVRCDGTTHEWSTDVQSDDKYAGGHATVEATIFVCSIAGCDEELVEQRIRLTR